MDTITIIKKAVFDPKKMTLTSISKDEEAQLGPDAPVIKIAITACRGENSK